MKEEACKNRFEEFNARDVVMESRHAAMEEREEGINELQQIWFNEHEKLMELQERSQRMEKADFAAAMNNMKSTSRQFITRTKVFGVSLQNINDVSHYHVSQSMTY